MTQNLVELTQAEFAEHYSLVTNHLNPSAGWLIGAEPANGCLFETYGAELEFINRQPLDRIWTLIHGEDGELYVVSGFHFVNRLGYLLSREPFPAKTLVQIRISTQTNNIGEFL